MSVFFFRQSRFDSVLPRNRRWLVTCGLYRRLRAPLSAPALGVLTVMTEAAVMKPQLQKLYPPHRGAFQQQPAPPMAQRDPQHLPLLPVVPLPSGDASSSAALLETAATLME
ncbi:hypothetical_protein [Leishmania braziliensis MHOM/BR/75/M2904]|uniref:Hypothetical_protein n=1 Tax=Leishmania braziliensis MHOM/BR/75/M2904 TaxID=420245 RepID=A0A3P3ZF42_LEIBR|nr:hypothetical_protein [Leishmania braziliensis MHOM/BR/75/M2904]